MGKSDASQRDSPNPRSLSGAAENDDDRIANPDAVKPGRLERFGRWIPRNWFEVVDVAGFAAVTVGSAGADGWKWFVIVPGIVAYLGARIGAWRRRPTYGQLESWHSEDERKATARQFLFRDLIDALLRQFAADVDFTDPDSRVSIYSHNGSALIMLARWSSNPLQSNGTGRVIYPENEGVIGIAWQRGSAVVDSLPKEPAPYRDASSRRCNVPKDVVDSLNMKSRSYVAVRAEHQGSQLGVVVLESTAPKRASSEVEQRVQGSKVWETLQMFMGSSIEVLPDIQSARREGY